MYNKSIQFRSQRGLLASLLLLTLLCVACVFGALAVDIGHYVTVRTELQNAVDAGALAGARDYIDSSSQHLVYKDALYTASKNKADGVAVSNSSKRTLVKVSAKEPDNGEPGECRVDGQMMISNFFARLFGNECSPLNVSANARAYSSINAVASNILFPIAVSVDTVTGHHKPLYQCAPGETVEFYLNSPSYGNAAFTSFLNDPDCSYVNEAIEQQLKLHEEQRDFIPPLGIGSRINLLPGARGLSSLTDGAENIALLKKGTLILPLISGDGPYKQVRPVVGFMGVHIDGIREDLGGQIAITATITKAVTKGKPGSVGTPTGIAAVDAGIAKLSPGLVMLSPVQQFPELANANPAPIKIANNFTAAPNASGPEATQPGLTLQATTDTVTGPVSSNNFNSSNINGSLWFDAVLRVRRNPNLSGRSVIRFVAQRVSFTSGGQLFSLRLPDSTIVLSNEVSVPTTAFDDSINSWVTIVPTNFNGGIFLGGMPVPSNLPGSIQNVFWNGSFVSDTAGLLLDWQWGAAPFTTLSNNLNALGVVAAGEDAGVPRNFVPFLSPAGGGTSSGGRNFTGSFSQNNTVFTQSSNSQNTFL
jgi:hypothetical protein